MTKVFVSAVIDAPIERVWAKVRDFNNLPEWHLSSRSKPRELPQVAFASACRAPADSLRP